MRWLGCVIVLAWAAALTATDIRYRRLPNALTLPGAAVILAVAADSGRGPAALCGALGLTALYLTVHLIAPGGLGGGDVKLAIGLGALTGAFGSEVWLLGALGAPLLTALCAAVGRIRVLPHGPSMCLASLTAVALALW